MAVIQRPVKTYGTRSYVSEVAAAPSNLATILSNEVDNDLDTVYGAWNGGADTVNIKDGAVTYAKLAADAKLWTDTGTVLTPTAAARIVSVVGGTAGTFGPVFIGGSRTAKLRLAAHPTADVGYFTYNLQYTGSAWVSDDAAKASWSVSLWAQSPEGFQINRAAAGTPATQVNLLTLDSAGKLTVPGNTALAQGDQLVLGARTAKGRLNTNQPSAATNTVRLTLNQTDAATQDDATAASWELTLRAGGVGDDFRLLRSPAGNPAGQVELCRLDNAGKMTVTGTESQFGMLKAGGTAVRNDLGVDSVGDGYITVNHPWGPQDATKPSYMIKMTPSIGGCSFFLRLANAAAGATTEVFKMGGGDLTISGATATKASGTTWANPSDARMKRNVTDYSTGLAAIRQLRPVSFEYNGELGTVDDGRLCWGFIAQEVEPVMPECVGEREWIPGPTNPMEPQVEPLPAPITVKTLDQSNMILALINAVKELAGRMDALETPA